MAWKLFPLRCGDALSNSTTKATPRGKIAQALGYCQAALRRVRQHFKQRGTLEPQTHLCGRTGYFNAQRQTRLRERVAEKPDATLAELCQNMDRPVAISTMDVWVKKLGYSFKKKSVHAAEQQWEDVAQKRASWHQELAQIPVDKLVFIDESGVSSNLTRLRGRALRNQRLVARVPHGHWQSNTVIAAVRLSGVCSPAVFNTATDTEVFEVYVEQTLLPELKPGDVVIMDNLPAHKVKSIRETIE